MALSTNITIEVPRQLLAGCESASELSLSASNVRAALESALSEKGADADRLKFLRDALTSVELDGNVQPQDI